MHERLLGAEQMGVAHAPTHDAAQDVAAPFVGRQHAVGDQKGGSPQMVRDDAVRGGQFLAGEIANGACQRRHDVDLVDAVHALHDGGEALQPHAGVDGRARQVDALAVGQLLILHENEIPDLDETVAVGVRAAGRAAGNMRAVIVEDFRARAAGADIARRPEIVGGGDADDFIVGQARDFFPQGSRLVVRVIDGDEQFVLRQAVDFCHQFPGKRNGVFLEIIAEAEIAHHLEEGRVARRVADILQIVVLAARPQAFLGGGRTLVVARLDAGE